MSTPILSTKLYIPSPRTKLVRRPTLVKQLSEGLPRKLTLISAPAGFGKSTLAGEWVAASQHPVAWLSLDEGDNDPARFLTYLIGALQTIVPTLGEGALRLLQTSQAPLPLEAILTVLLNEITTLAERFILVLDDYHSIDAKAVHDTVSFLVAYLPPQIHLVIVTREDPPLPLARLRVRNQLAELRVAELRFTLTEVAEFFQEVIPLNLSAENIAALEARTEGWVAGLQLAAISMQGLQDTNDFIESFTGSHHFILDYLVEEVLHKQSDSIQTFLLQTSILDRFCAPLCDAVLLDADATGQATLEAIENANLFIVPLDNERRWYRYHHLFAELLRQRLRRSATTTDVAELHKRASAWYEGDGLELEAFHHAVAAQDVPRAERLLKGTTMPLHFRGAALPVLNWLESLPTTTLDANPTLWVFYASALLFASRLTNIEAKLQAAETALQQSEPNEKSRDLIGHIAVIRATLAVSQHKIDTILTQSRRALDNLHPHNLPVRTATTWAMGYAYYLQGKRVAARQAYTEALAISQRIGHFIITVMSTIGLGNLQEEDTHLYQAVETYHQVLELIGEPPLPVACQVHLGLARIHYEWNDLEAAHQHTLQSIQLARQLENTDRVVACDLLLARINIALGDMASASALVKRAEQTTHQHHFVYRLPDIAATQVALLLYENEVEQAAQLVQSHDLPMSAARVYLAQGKVTAALAVLDSWRHKVEAEGWADKWLKVMVLQAVSHHLQGDSEKGLLFLGEALALAEPNGFIRLFVDEGMAMAQLLSEANARGVMPEYTHNLLGAFQATRESHKAKSPPNASPSPMHLIEPLSQREIEVLRLIALGFSNHEIGEQLFLSLNTVKGHNQRIFGKLQVQRRTEAVARARELGLV